MQGKKIIEDIRDFTLARKDISGMILTGSWARGEATERSDVDTFLITNTKPEIVFQDLAETLGDMVVEIISSSVHKRIFFVGPNYLKIDISVYPDIAATELLFRGSRITDISRAVILDRDGLLQKTVKEWVLPDNTPDFLPLITEMTEGFMDMFELASRYSFQNDAYRFYFTYNIALARYTGLLQLQKKSDAYLYTPRSLLEEMDETDQKRFRCLAGSLDVKNAELLLENISDDFLNVYQDLFSHYPRLPREPETIVQFLMAIRNRDNTQNQNEIL